MSIEKFMFRYLVKRPIAPEPLVLHHGVTDVVVAKHTEQRYFKRSDDGLEFGPLRGECLRVAGIALDTVADLDGEIETQQVRPVHGAFEHARLGEARPIRQQHKAELLGALREVLEGVPWGGGLQ